MGLKGDKIMMHTYEFTFWQYLEDGTDLDEGEDAIQFCANNVEEATEMFNEWIHEEYACDWQWKLLNVEEVYNPYDAAEYGDNYGGICR